MVWTAEAPMFDGGEWEYVQNMEGDAPHVTKHFVETPNSQHDIRLYINGNLDDDLARKYGEELAAFLNRPAATHFEQRLAEVKAYEQLPPSVDSVIALTKLSTCAAIDKLMGHDEAIVIITKANAQLKRMKEQA